jgi:hypothetical protein
MSERPSLEALRQAVGELIKDMQRVVGLGVRGGERLSAALAYGYVKRGVGTLQGALAISNAGLGSEVGALTRVITEAGIYATWILQKAGQDRSPEDREARAQDVWDAQIFDEERRRRLWAQNGYGTAAAAADALRAIEEIRQTRGLAPDRRFELSVVNLATEAGGGLGEHYDLAYRINCLDSHPTLDAIMRALRDDDEHREFVHSRSLAITCISGLNLTESCYQLMGRGEEFVALREAVTACMGLPANMFAPKRTTPGG